MKRIENCTVIHVDAHSDLYLYKQKDLRLLNDIEMSCGDYLWYAIRDNFVNEIYWVCPANLIDFNCKKSVEKIIGSNITRSIDVSNNILDIDFKKHKQVFTGFTAQIIQHEVDHCDGIII